MQQNSRFWYLLHRRAAKALVRLPIWAVSPEPLLLAYGRLGPELRPLAPLDNVSIGV